GAEKLLRQNEGRPAELDQRIKQRLAEKNHVQSADELPTEVVTQAIRKQDLLTVEEFEQRKLFNKRKEIYQLSVKSYDPVAYSVCDGPYLEKERKGWTPQDVFILPIGN